MFLLLQKILMKFEFICYFSVFTLFFSQWNVFFHHHDKLIFVEMFKYTLKCGSLQNKIWYYSALVPKYLPSEASIPGPSLVIVVAICCRSSVRNCFFYWSRCSAAWRVSRASQFWHHTLFGRRCLLTWAPSRDFALYNLKTVPCALPGAFNQRILHSTSYSSQYRC